MKKFSAYNGFFTHCPNISQQNANSTFQSPVDDNINATQNLNYQPFSQTEFKGNDNFQYPYNNTESSKVGEQSRQAENIKQPKVDTETTFEPPLHYPQSEDYYSQIIPNTQGTAKSLNQTSNQNNINLTTDQSDNSNSQNNTQDEQLSIKAKSLFKCMQDHDYYLRNIKNY